MRGRQTAQERAADVGRPEIRRSFPVRPAHPLLDLQCAIGNHAVGQLIEQRRTDASGQAGETTVPRIVERALRSPGQPLDPAVRSRMESRFDQDFGRVRVHTGAGAAESAARLGALAYTSGNDVVFGAGQFAPATRDGERLLAHELTHVVQQGGRPAAGQPSSISQPSDAAETEATTAADRVAHGGHALLPASPASAPATTIHLQPAAKKGMFHTVEENTLWQIAEKLYDDKGLWWRIYNANKEIIGSNPDTGLRKGMVLWVPARDLLEALGVEAIGSMNKANAPGSGINYPPPPRDGKSFDSLDSNFWDRVTAYKFILKPGKSASDAIDSAFRGPSKLDCQASASAVFARALKEVLGRELFDRKFGHAGWRNQRLHIDNTGFDWQWVTGILGSAWGRLKEGDRVYFANVDEYKTVCPGGFFAGLHAVYEGSGKFSGLGVAHKTEDEVNRALFNAYNTDCPGEPRTALTFEQWKSTTNANGERPGLLALISRYDLQKVLDLLRW